MSENYDFADLIQDPDQLRRRQQDQLAKAEELQQRMREVTGRATSEDERIAVTFSEANGLQGLTIDPRAMRAGSEELAEQIMAVVNQAREDAVRQSNDLVQEVFGDSAPDPGKLLEQVPDFEQSMNELFEDTARMGDELTEIVERMRRMTEG